MPSQSAQRFSKVAILVAIVGLVAGSATWTLIDAAEELVPSEIVQVNTILGSDTNDPSVAVGADGSIVVVWDRTATEIRGRRFDPSLAPEGDPFLVSQNTTWAQDPDVCLDDDGDFVAVWREDTGFDDEIAFRRNIFGAMTGNDTGLVTSTAAGFRQRPSVDCTSASDFVAVWHGDTDSNGDTIVGRRVTGGVPDPSSGQFQVPSEERDTYPWADVALDPSGNFVVVWPQEEVDVDSVRGPIYPFEGVNMRRFEADGTPLDAEQVVVYQADGTQWALKPRVDRAANGDFAVAWQNVDSFPSFGTVELFDTNGVSQGSENLLPAGDYSNDLRPAVAYAGSDGTIFVGLNAPDSADTVVQSYTAALVPEESVDTDAATSRGGWDMAGTPDGGVVLVWEDGDDIFIQMFERALFADGFETGNTSAWSP